jgi:sugar diacid utilization regulator
MFDTRPMAELHSPDIVTRRSASMSADAITATDVYRKHGLLEEIRIAHGAMIEAVVGGQGAQRVAELTAAAAGGRVALAIPGSFVTAAPGAPGASAAPPAIMRWLAERLSGRPSTVPPGVLAEVPIRFRDRLIGVAALLDGEQRPRDDAVEFLHLAAAAVVTLLAIENAREETEQKLRGSLLEDLRSRAEMPASEVVRRAARLGCDLSRGAVILCAELNSDRPHRAVAMIINAHPGALAYELGGTPPRVYAALPAADGGDPAATLAAAKQLALRMKAHGTVGLSSFHIDPGGLRCALQEAELVVDVLSHSDSEATGEIGSGTYKLLFRMLASHREEAQGFYDATIAPMVRYDDQYRTELVRTLQAYLDANCNMNATASAIYAHRHTVAYRLVRIHELTGLDPTLSEDRERLGLGLKLHRIIAAQAAALDIGVH